MRRCRWVGCLTGGVVPLKCQMGVAALPIAVAHSRCGGTEQSRRPFDQRTVAQHVWRDSDRDEKVLLRAPPHSTHTEPFSRGGLAQASLANRRREAVVSVVPLPSKKLCGT